MLSQTAGYAITALACIAGQDQPVLVKVVAEMASIPKDYLGKIINTLARKGLVQTQRGIGGGVSMSADPGELSLYDICLAFDDPITQERCMLGTDRCSDQRNCPCHSYWSKARKRTTDFLRRTTIQDVANFELRLMKEKGYGSLIEKIQ